MEEGGGDIFDIEMSIQLKFRFRESSKRKEGRIFPWNDKIKFFFFFVLLTIKYNCEKQK